MMCTNNKRSTTARHQRKQSQTARRTVRWRGQASERASKEERTSRCAAFCSPPDHRANLNRSLGSGRAQGPGSVRPPWLPRGRKGFIVRFAVCRLSGEKRKSHSFIGWDEILPKAVMHASSNTTHRTTSSCRRRRVARPRSAVESSRQQQKQEQEDT